MLNITNERQIKVIWPDLCKWSWFIQCWNKVRAKAAYKLHNYI